MALARDWRRFLEMSEDRRHLGPIAERQRTGETLEQQAAERVLVCAAWCTVM